jgi:hypothetical protein
LTGLTIGSWFVLHQIKDPKKQKTLWKCKCVCGKFKIVSGQDIRLGKSTNCGCKKWDSRKYKLDENYFNKIDTEDKAYFLGWLFADGCNMVEKGIISIGLQDQDKIILELFKKYIQAETKLYYVKPVIVKKKGGEVIYNQKGTACLGKPQFVLHLTSKNLSKQLKSKGCIPRKSNILTFPNKKKVPIYLLPHFIRGYFEGDGSISFKIFPNGPQYYTLGIYIVGTENFLSGIKDYLLKKGLKSVRLYKENNKSKSNTYALRIRNIRDVILFKKIIYDNYLLENITNSELILPRKFEKFRDIQEYKVSNDIVVRGIRI